MRNRGEVAGVVWLAPIVSNGAQMPRPELAFRFRDERGSAAPERRQTARFQIVKPARIVLNNDWTTINATIIDSNETGARLKLAMAADLPRKFMLVITGENVIVPVRCVWRSDDEVGVAFAGERQPAPPQTNR